MILGAGLRPQPIWGKSAEGRQFGLSGCKTLSVPIADALRSIRTAGPGRPPAKSVTRVFIALAAVSMGTAWAGDLFLATIVENRPLALIALNARTRNLVLAIPNTTVVPFFTIAFLRLLATDPLYFLLGYWHGDKAIAWTERRSRTYGPMVRDMENWFGKYAYFFIFAMPNNIISALSGAAGIKARTFIALNISGTLIRLTLVWKFGDFFSPQVNGLVEWISAHKLLVFGLSAAGVAWTVFGEFRGDNGEVSTLKEMIDDDAADPTAGASTDVGENHDGDRPASE